MIERQEVESQRADGHQPREKDADKSIFLPEFGLRRHASGRIETMGVHLARSYSALQRTSATHSTCWVWGNISSGITRTNSKTLSRHKMFKSRAMVAGWQET